MLKYILLAGFILFNLGTIDASQPKVDQPKSGPVCEICTFVLKTAQSLLEQNKTADEAIQFIENELCSRLGGLKDTCSKYVEQYGPVIIFMLAQDIDPSVVCNHIGLCQTMVVDPNPLITPIVSGDTLNCSLCKLVFTQVQNMLKNNASEEQLIQLIEKTLCNATGSLSDTCKALIDTYGPTILQLLAKDVDPAKICELIGMCKTSRKNFRFMKEKVRMNKMAKLHKIKADINDTPYCIVCQYAAQFIQNELKKNSTEQSIVDILEGACKLAPASTQQQCKTLIDTYGIYLVQLVAQFEDPEKVCKAIKLC